MILGEFESREVALSPAAHALLTRRYAYAVEVAPAAQAGRCRLTGRGFVGRVGLPGGDLLVLAPKVGVRHLFHLLTIATELAHFQPPPTVLTADPEVLGFVLAALVHEIETLLRGGLYQAFEEQTADLALGRGRLDPAAQIRRHADLLHRQVCVYAERTPDTAENQVIAATLRLLPGLLRRPEDAVLRARVRAAARRFADVTPVGRGAALALLDRVTAHRLNAAFVTVRLQEHLRPAGLRVVAQRRDTLDEAGRLGIRPDVLIFAPGAAVPALVLDAKYRRLSTLAGSDLNADLYQVSAYLDRYGLRRGVLVYPRFGETEEAEVRLRGTAKRVQMLTLDLSAGDVPSLEAEVGAFARRVAALARADSPAAGPSRLTSA